MIVTLIYNEFVKTIDIDINKKIGIIQEDLLNKCGLIIYNIEYSEIILEDTSNDTSNDTLKLNYVLGSEEANFNITLKEFLESIKMNEEIIEKIIIYDRKRDINGNVIKDNIIIERYTEWVNTQEDENINNNYSNFTPLNNRHIIRFPLESLLTNILNIPRSGTSSNEYNINEFYNENIRNQLFDNESDNNELTESSNNELTESSDNELTESSNNETNNIIPNIDNIPINNLTIDPELVNATNAYLNIFATRLNQINNNNQINEIPLNNESTYNIFDNFIRNVNIIPLNHSFDNFNVNTSIINDYNYSYESLDLDIIQDDVKIVLSEEEFDNIESDIYINKTENNSMECLICTEYFEDSDSFKKLNCNHLFHTGCIKPWLCEESYKCPICRVDTGKGIIKN